MVFKIPANPKIFDKLPILRKVGGVVTAPPPHPTEISATDTFRYDTVEVENGPYQARKKVHNR